MGRKKLAVVFGILGLVLFVVSGELGGVYHTCNPEKPELWGDGQPCFNREQLIPTYPWARSINETLFAPAYIFYSGGRMYEKQLSSISGLPVAWMSLATITVLLFGGVVVEFAVIGYFAGFLRKKVKTQQGA